MNRLIQRNFSATARLLRVEKNIITPAKENAGMPKPGEIVRVHYTGNFKDVIFLNYDPKMLFGTPSRCEITNGHQIIMLLLLLRFVKSYFRYS